MLASLLVVQDLVPASPSAQKHAPHVVATIHRVSEQ